MVHASAPAVPSHSVLQALHLHASSVVSHAVNMYLQLVQQECRGHAYQSAQLRPGSALTRLRLLCFAADHRNNYVGTRMLMQLASQMDNLRAFVHVSTFFVNNFRPYNCVCEEQIYPLDLKVDGRPVDHRCATLTHTHEGRCYPAISSKPLAQVCSCLDLRMS